MRLETIEKNLHKPPRNTLPALQDEKEGTLEVRQCECMNELVVIKGFDKNNLRFVVLKEFGPGVMVKEFDQVVFNDEVGVVHGPIKTQFGYHLILINDRTE